MKKITFYRACKGTNHAIEYRQDNGYLYTVSDGKTTLELAISKTTCNRWDITHIDTGFLILNGLYNTRQEIINQITDEYVKKIIDILKDPRIINAANRLNEYLQQLAS